jgi:hypothetical protein
LRLPQLLLTLFLGCTLLGQADAQKLLDRKLPANHAKNDPYTEGGTPELMKAAGIISHGGFEFGSTDTASVDDYLANSDIRWLETEHFQLGFALSSYRVSQKEKKVLLRDLTRLAERLPTVDPKTKLLDPWLRAHLTAMRLEDIYTDFLSIVQMQNSDFPDGTKPWTMEGQYQGEGPYLGQKGKYEVLLLPSKAVHVDFLNKHFGLQLTRTQRWNKVDRETLTLTAHIQQGSLKKDTALHGHLAFNMAHNCYDGLRHYSYDTPIWLHEGLAHFMERRISPEYNTFDGSEGSMPVESKVKDWGPKVRSLVSSRKAPRMAKLIRLKNYGEMTLTEHFCTWSMVDYLYQTQPDKFAEFLRGLKGRTTKQGFADGSNIPDAHRDLFKDVLGMSYSSFDTKWAEWVLANY